MIKLDIKVNYNYKNLNQENKENKKFRFSNDITRDELAIDIYKSISNEKN